MAITVAEYTKHGMILNAMLKPYNYQVAPNTPAGRPGKVVKLMREYRLQLIDKQRDTSNRLVNDLPDLVRSLPEVKYVTFNKISPNSSKFPSVSFTLHNQVFDLVIARGANRGETFETATISDLAAAFKVRTGGTDHHMLIDMLNEANSEFASTEIINVTQRIGSTRKEGVALENLASVIGDIVLEDSARRKWYVSLKSINGDTVSSYSGAASLFNARGELQPNSSGAAFLKSFGVDLNKVQDGFDVRSGNPQPNRRKIAVSRPNQTELRTIFERAWGVNYFYVRKRTVGWEVFWLDRTKLDKLTRNIRVTEIRYPDKTTKQITILCENAERKYRVEVRNSKSGEYPNDIKIKVR